MPELQVKPIAPSHLHIPFDWAREEGWNPGLHDETSFSLVDPMGFIGGYLNDELVATISAMRYNEHFGFLGFYIVSPVHRGKGYGLKVWNAGIDHLKDLPCVGLDGVLEQTANYQKSGFTFVHKNCRYEGRAHQLQASTSSELTEGGFTEGGCTDGRSINGRSTNDLSTDECLQPLSEVAFETLIGFDAQHFPTHRVPFLQSWVTQAGHHGLAIMRAEQMCAYGIIRACSQGHKIGPLFAQTEVQARTLIAALCASLESDELVYLDPPATNLAAIHLVLSLGMEMVFETARMYKGQIPHLPVDHIYGITSFELG